MMSGLGGSKLGTNFLVAEGDSAEDVRLRLNLRAFKSAGPGGGFHGSSVA